MNRVPDRKQPRLCYYCRKPLTKETPMHCQPPKPGCDICADCSKARRRVDT